ncbi:MAG: CotH kinase family protein [Acidobacteria bacterium]|nr:CotH kinase family protein [Acidobacteriota bacterium]
MIKSLPLLLLPLVLAAQPQSSLRDTAAVFFDDSAVREIRLYFDDTDWYNTLLRAHQTAEDPYFPCRFRSGDISLEKIGCRFKGNSSAQRNGIKKPFKLDFNEYDDDANFLGLKKLNLNNFDLQPDFMREKLLHDLAGNYIAALRSVYVRLYVNDAFYGLYLAVEQPDMVMMRSRWGSSEDGNLYEGEERMGAGSRPNLSYLGAAQSAYESVYLLKSNEEKNDFSRLIQFLDILNNTPAGELPSSIESIADIENWMYAMALNNLVVNLDSYLGAAAEYYLYDRTLDSKFIHIQWDHNESFGITGDGTPRLTSPATTDPFYLPTATTGGGPGGGNAASNARPLLEKLWAVDEYKRLYLRALAQFIREGFAPQTISARVTQLASLIRSHVTEDPNKAYTAGQFETALNAAVGNIPGINQFVTQRYAFLRNYLDNQAQPADVRINEITTNNSGALKDEAGDSDPWVEIHNLGPGPVNLSGFYLTDDPAQPTQWPLPSRTLADGEYLVVWLDAETAEGASHAGFKMPASGAKLYLFGGTTTTAPLDTATIATTSSGQSQIRLGHYGARWQLTTQPTPGAVNVSAATPAVTTSGTGQLLITEVMADNDSIYQDPDEAGAYEDWFEIYNPTASAIDMSGMYITDNPQNPTKWKVGDGVVIPAGGYLVFLADSEPTQGPRHASFSLSADGESVSLYAANGTTLIDTVTFPAQKKDVAYGRVNGTGDWTFLASPTPGQVNSGPQQ